MPHAIIPPPLHPPPGPPPQKKWDKIFGWKKNVKKTWKCPPLECPVSKCWCLNVWSACRFAEHQKVNVYLNLNLKLESFVTSHPSWCPTELLSSLKNILALRNGKLTKQHADKMKSGQHIKLTINPVCKISCWWNGILTKS